MVYAKLSIDSFGHNTCLHELFLPNRVLEGLMKETDNLSLCFRKGGVQDQTKGHI